MGKMTKKYLILFLIGSLSVQNHLMEDTIKNIRWVHGDKMCHGFVDELLSTNVMVLVIKSEGREIKMKCIGD